MDMVPVSPAIVYTVRAAKRRSKCIPVIEEFVNSDEVAVELMWQADGYVSAYSCRSAYYRALRAMQVGVCVITRSDHVYLIKEDSVNG